MTSRPFHPVVPALSHGWARLRCCPRLAARRPRWPRSAFTSYENAKGITVIDDRVPPQLAHKGYTVLNRGGRVVEVVPRTLTAEERKANPGAVQAMLRAEEAERQRRYDEALLARYSAVADIEDLQRRKVNEVQVRSTCRRASIAGLKQQLESEHAKAADLEQAGQPVTADIQTKMEELRASIAEEEARISQARARTGAPSRRDYQFDIERLSAAIRPGSR